MLIKGHRIIVDVESIKKIGKRVEKDQCVEKEDKKLQLLMEKILSEAYEKAQSIVDDAKREAEKIVLDAQERAKAIVEEARKSYEKEIEATEKEREKLKNIIKSISMLIEREISRLSEMLLPVVKVLLKKILEKEIDEELILRRIRSVLSKMYDTAIIILKINPADVELVERIKDTIPSNVKIQPDPSVETGGVIVESRWGIMDKSTTFQWKMVEDIIDEVYNFKY